MKKLNTTHPIQDLLDKISLVKNSIKENTSSFSVRSMQDSLIFDTKENIQIRIRLYK